jgi:hypothetical protein
LIKGLSFDQFLRESTIKPKKNHINTIENQSLKKENRERKNIGKYFVNRAYNEGSRA